MAPDIVLGGTPELTIPVGSNAGWQEVPKGKVKRWGTIAVGAATPVQVAAENPGRKLLVIQNVGANNVFLGMDSTVSTTKGLKLGANTQPLLDERTTGEWWAIADGTGSTIFFYEV